MRILHTADWHLGKKLENMERYDEQQLFLQWLLQTLFEKKIDVLLVAGDVFDSAYPPAEAQKLYYNFLSRIKDTGCRHVIITGGNHDSVMALNASKELLRYFNIEVIGGVSERIADAVIAVANEDGTPELIVYAAPFLRDKDVKPATISESYDERAAAIVRGMAEYFESLCLVNADVDVPKILMGHLYAAGATPTESERDVLVGGLGQFPASLFPKKIDYVALGHLHRPQTVSAQTHIRYSGSPVALSFSEAFDNKIVVLLETIEGRMDITELALPKFRGLLRFTGNFEEIKSLLQSFSLQPIPPLGFWCEVQLVTDEYLPNIEKQLTSFLPPDSGINKFFIRQIKSAVVTDVYNMAQNVATFKALDPKDVFEKKIEGQQLDEEQKNILRNTFSEALVLIHQPEVLADMENTLL